MAKVEDVARGVLAALDTDAGLLLACRWVVDRYSQLCSRARFRHLREVGEVVIPAQINVGTVTANRGSNVVVGDSTAQSVWGEFIRGRSLRIQNVWYEINAIAPDGSLRLKSPFSEDNQVGASYAIVPRYIALDPRVRWMGEFRHSRRSFPIKRKSLAELDMLAPMRSDISDGPVLVAEVGAAQETYSNPSADGNVILSGRPRIVEFYPYSINTELIHYVYWSMPPKPSPEEYISDNVDEYVLRELALVDAMRYKMSQAMNAGKVEEAAHWRNEYRMQKTSCEKEILEAIRADKGSDDQTFILERSGSIPHDRDIVNARDQVWSNWPL